VDLEFFFVAVVSSAVADQRSHLRQAVIAVAAGTQGELSGSHLFAMQRQGSLRA
jgi:hypothetical protein